MYIAYLLSQNLEGESVIVKVYLMDLEVLFSSTPFLQNIGANFSFVRPSFETAPVLIDPLPCALIIDNHVKIPLSDEATVVALPEHIANGNVFIEVEAGSISKSQTVFASSLRCEVLSSSPYDTHIY